MKRSKMKKMQSRMRKQIGHGVARGSVLFEIAEDIMDIVVKAKIFKKMSNRK